MGAVLFLTSFQAGCYKNCPAKTYSVEEDMTCVPCTENCVSCDEHECYWCETDLFLSGKRIRKRCFELQPLVSVTRIQLHSPDGGCVSACPDGFYGDGDTNDCEECHADCARCAGPLDSDCLWCEDGKALDKGRCVAEQDVCPVKSFLGGEADASVRR